MNAVPDSVNDRVEVLTAAVEGPVLLDSPHSGHRYPADFRHACPLQRLRRAEDSHVDRLFANGPRLGATLVHALFPRAYIDPNRPPDDIDPLLLGEAIEGRPVSEKSRLGIGLVWRKLTDGTPIYDRHLTRDEIEQRIAGYWQPYHQSVAAAHQRIVARHGHVVHLNCHSMPSVSPLYPRRWDGRMPYDFVIGTREGSSASPALCAFIVELLERRGHAVGVDDPYMGVELLRRFGRPALQQHSVQIEVNRRLYMDESTFELHEGFARTQATLDALVEALQTVHRLLR
jgi:N-formylglutamate deformylase